MSLVSKLPKLEVTDLWKYEQKILKPSLRIFFNLKARIVCGNKGTGAGVLGGLGRTDGMRIEDMGDLFGYGGFKIFLFSLLF